MKIKYLLGSLFMALLGAAIALFAYTKLNAKPSVTLAKDSSKVEVRDAEALLTSLQMQEGQIDFTYAAEQTVHAVVHVRTKSMIDFIFFKNIHFIIIFCKINSSRQTCRACA